MTGPRPEDTLEALERELGIQSGDDSDALSALERELEAPAPAPAPVAPVRRPMPRPATVLARQQDEFSGVRNPGFRAALEAGRDPRLDRQTTREASRDQISSGRGVIPGTRTALPPVVERGAPSPVTPEPGSEEELAVRLMLGRSRMTDDPRRFVRGGGVTDIVADVGRQFTRGLAEVGHGVAGGVARLMHGEEGLPEPAERALTEERAGMREFYGDPTTTLGTPAAVGGALTGAGALYMLPGSMLARLAGGMPVTAQGANLVRRLADPLAGTKYAGGVRSRLLRDLALNTPLNATFAASPEDASATFLGEITDTDWLREAGKSLPASFAVESAVDVAGGGLIEGLAAVGRGARPGARVRPDVPPPAPDLGDDVRRSLLERLRRRAAEIVDPSVRVEGERRNVAEREANTSTVTGLPNKRAYDAARAAAEADPETAVIRIDANGFKRVNDVLGHQRGDEELRAIGETLRGVVGQRGRVFHPSGDEFVVLAPKAEAEALRDAIEAAYGVRDLAEGVRTSLSAGIGDTDELADAAARARKPGQKAEQGIAGREAETSELTKMEQELEQRTAARDRQSFDWDGEDPVDVSTWRARSPEQVEAEAAVLRLPGDTADAGVADLLETVAQAMRRGGTDVADTLRRIVLDDASRDGGWTLEQAERALRVLRGDEPAPAGTGRTAETRETEPVRAEEEDDLDADDLDADEDTIERPPPPWQQQRDRRLSMAVRDAIDESVTDDELVRRAAAAESTLAPYRNKKGGGFRDKAFVNNALLPEIVEAQDLLESVNTARRMRALLSGEVTPWRTSPLHVEVERDRTLLDRIARDGTGAARDRAVALLRELDEAVDVATNASIARQRQEEEEKAKAKAKKKKQPPPKQTGEDLVRRFLEEGRPGSAEVQRLINAEAAKKKPNMERLFASEEYQAAVKRANAEDAAVEGADDAIDVDADELDEEAGEPTASTLSGPAGREASVTMSDGRKVPVRYRVIESGALVSSHNPFTFQSDARYPKGVQGRDYAKDKTAQDVVRTRAQQLDADLALDASIAPDKGPPMVTREGFVIAGNERSMLVRRAARSAKQRYASYRAELERRAAEFGLTPEAVRGMKEPVLVREITDPKISGADAGALGELNRLSDTPDTKTKRAADDAGSRAVQFRRAADALEHYGATVQMDETLADYLSRAEGREFVRKLVDDGVIAAQERARYVDPRTGAVTDDGKALLRRMMFAAAVDDAGVVGSAPAGVVSKLEHAVPAIVTTRGIEQWDVGPQVQRALELLTEAKGKGIKLADLLDQSSMFEAGVDPEAARMAIFLDGKSKKEITEAFRTYATRAREAVQRESSIDMFGGMAEGPAPTRGQVFGSPSKRGRGRADDELSLFVADTQADIFGRVPSLKDSAVGKRTTPRAPGPEDAARAQERLAKPIDAEEMTRRRDELGFEKRAIPGADDPAQRELLSPEDGAPAVKRIADYSDEEWDLLREALEDNADSLSGGARNTGRLNYDLIDRISELMDHARKKPELGSLWAALRDFEGTSAALSVSHARQLRSVLRDMGFAPPAKARGKKASAASASPAGGSTLPPPPGPPPPASAAAGGAPVPPSFGDLLAGKARDAGLTPAMAREILSGVAGGVVGTVVGGEDHPIAGAIIGGMVGANAMRGANAGLRNIRRTTKALDEVQPRIKIARDLAAAVGVPLRQGRFNAAARKAQGVFFPHEAVTAVRRFDDVRTAAHEVGHFISHEHLGEKLGKLKALPKPVLDELEKAGRALYGSRKPRNGYVSEGVAEYFAAVVTEPNRLAKEFPATHQLLEPLVRSKEPLVAAAVDHAASAFARFRRSTPEARVDAMISVGETAQAGLKLDDILRAMDSDLVDMQRGIEALRPGMEPGINNPLTLAHNARGYAASARKMIKSGIVVNGKQVTRGLEEVLADINAADLPYGVYDTENPGPFRRYLVAAAVPELHARGINVGIDLEDAKAVIANTPEHLKKLAQEFWAIRNALVDYRVEHGRMLPEEAKAWKSREFPTPMHVVFGPDEGPVTGRSGGGPRAKASSGMQRIKGSARPKVDPIESLIREIYTTVREGLEHEAQVMMVRLAADTPGGGRVMSFVETPKEAVSLRLDDNLIDQLEAEGHLAPDAIAQLRAGVAEADTAAMLHGFQEKGVAGMAERKDLVFPVKVDGERKWVKVEDKNLYRTMLNLNPAERSAVMRFFGAPTRMARAGLVLEPGFIGYSVLRDIGEAFVRTHSTRPVAPFEHLVRGTLSMLGSYLHKKPNTLAKVVANFISDPRLADEWLRRGGGNASLQAQDRARWQAAQEEIRTTALRRGWKVVREPFSTLRRLGEMSSDLHRLGEVAITYPQQLKRGRSPADAMTASVWFARNALTDFAVAGTVMREINNVSMFANAQYRGLRNFRDDLAQRPTTVILRAIAGLTLPAVGLYLTQRTDPVYKNVPRYVRDHNFVVVWPPVAVRRTYGMADEDASVYLFPKAFEYGAAFATVPERIAEYLDTEDPASLKRATDALYDAFVPDLEPNLVKLARELYKGEDSFRRTPIVPRGREGLEPSEQYSPRTGDVARLAGRALNVSPAKAEHLVQGLTGKLGMEALRAADAVTAFARERTGKEPLRDKGLDTPGFRGSAIARRFVRPAPGLDAEPVSRFFEERDRAERRRRTWRQKIEDGEIRDAAAYLNRHLEDIILVATEDDAKHGVGGPGVLRRSDAKLKGLRDLRRHVIQHVHGPGREDAIRRLEAAIQLESEAAIEKMRRTKTQVRARRGGG